MTGTIDMDGAVAVTPRQGSADVGGEFVILSIASGEYFGVNEVEHASGR